MLVTQSQFSRLRAVSKKQFPVSTACAARWVLPLLLLLTQPAVAQAQFNHTTNNGAITITGYTGAGGAVAIPATINDLPVTGIGVSAFLDLDNLTSVTIPDSVTSIGDYAFAFCASLASIAIPNSITDIREGTFSRCASLGSVSIPNSVTNIGDDAFSYCASLTNLTIPDRVTNIGERAFYLCTNLTGVYFQGNAPSIGPEVFALADNATVYYLPGTTGWGTTFAGRPAVLWNPLAATSDASFGVRTNRFGFTITGASNLVIVVEAATNMAAPAWVAVGTNTLADGSSYFADPQWTNYPARFYRLRSP